MSDSTSTRLPYWLQEIIHFLPIKSQFVLSGNIWDRYIPRAGAQEGLRTLFRLLCEELSTLPSSSNPYGVCISFNPSTGLDCFPTERFEWVEAECSKVNVNIGRGQPIPLPDLGRLLRHLITLQSGHRVAFFFDYASQLVESAERLQDYEHEFFRTALDLSHRATHPFHTVFWVANRAQDLPPWLSMDNSRVRGIQIPRPESETRKKVFQHLATQFPDWTDLVDEDRTRLLKEAVDLTEDMLCRDLLNISLLAREKSIPMARVEDAIRLYKFGVAESPWKNISVDQVKFTQTLLQKRVKGQTDAVEKAVALVKRAVTGLAGGTTPGRGRPKGVLFLAGPTGVGKTELAKTLTTALFGEASNYVRFDMSEFGSEHADQRLLGAPPGYVGFDAGGELTNAIRQKPFSLILFDEIEKAHPKLWDKFLQILDEGTLTSGRGERVYFSECVIVFTSNLGIYKTVGDEKILNVDPDKNDTDQVRELVRKEIDQYFSKKLERPELLNRIGENIVVCDFIRHPHDREILELLVADLAAAMKDQSDLSLSVSPGAMDQIAEVVLPSARDKGGRGIRNQLESLIVNPLSLELFELPDFGNGMKLEIRSFRMEGKEPQLEILRK